MKRLKVGDRVKVIQSFSRYDDYLIGIKGTIEIILGDEYLVLLDNDRKAYYCYRQQLVKLKKKQPSVFWISKEYLQSDDFPFFSPNPEQAHLYIKVKEYK